MTPNTSIQTAYDELVEAIVKAVPSLSCKCTSCDGEGKKECSNPDCNFIQAIACIGDRSASESQCPECGYKGISKCDDCMGLGILYRPITLEDVLRANISRQGHRDLAVDEAGHFWVREVISWEWKS